MDLFIAAAEHEPGMHGPVALVILIVLVVGAFLVWLIRAFRSRKRSSEQSGRDEDRGGT